MKTKNSVREVSRHRLLGGPVPRSHSEGFTLIELLTVIAIIMVLAGLIVGGAKYAMTKAGRSRAEAEIAAMENALENFKTDNGTYPITQPVRPTSAIAPLYANAPLLYTALAGGPGNPKTYMTFKPNQIQVPGPPAPQFTTNIVDPFGMPYNYYCTQPLQSYQTNSVTFDLWSYGPSGTNGAVDMITNWKQ